MSNEGINTGSRSSIFNTSNEEEQIIPMTVELHLPTAIIDEMKVQHDFCEHSCDWVDWSVGIENEDDDGWMYRMLTKDDDDDDEDRSYDMIHTVNKLNIPHLIWPSDSF